MEKPRIIAFYLPQYHPTKHNDEWWGKGFTEWTNVGKASPLFRGHYQPKVPADLGYYDLRIPEVREQQVELAREAGITGFCYYHYWFERGKVELEFPFNEVVEKGKPDFPFCLCWANESWSKKMWNNDGSIRKQVTLVEQKYEGAEDNKEHFYYLKRAFLDERYMKYEGKPIFLIYRPLDFVNIKEFIRQWDTLARECGLPGMYFIGYSLKINEEYKLIKQSGFDAVCSCRLGEQLGTDNLFKHIMTSLRVRMNIPRVYNYKDVIPTLIGQIEKDNSDVYPTLVPNWDHTPRSGGKGYLYANSTPFLFKQHAIQVLKSVLGRKEKDQIIFLKSWNEWGEGNYMEPDLKFGKGYINALHEAIAQLK